jgi:hypothetical protein
LESTFWLLFGVNFLTTFWSQVFDYFLEWSHCVVFWAQVLTPVWQHGLRPYCFWWVNKKIVVFGENFDCYFVGAGADRKKKNNNSGEIFVNTQKRDFCRFGIEKCSYTFSILKSRKMAKFSLIFLSRLVKGRQMLNFF